MKHNLPVILLKGIVMLPNNEIKLDLDSKESKNIIDFSYEFHDSKVLIVPNLNLLEEKPHIKELPNYGVIAKVVKKLVLPDGRVRVVLKGLKRAVVLEYLKQDKYSIDSFVKELDDILVKNEEILKEKLYKEIVNYIKKIPYLSNSILTMLNKDKDLSSMTDTICYHLINDQNRLIEYLKEANPEKRMIMILEDLYHEEELFNLEKSIDLKVQKNLDKNELDYFLKEKIKYLQSELGEISTKESELNKLKNQIDNLACPKHIKNRLEEEYIRYSNTPSTSPEVNTIRSYIDTLLQLPWTIETKDNNDIKIVSKKLNESHYGLDSAKERILEYLVVNEFSKKLKTPIICLVGPPGVGKTTLAYSIASALNRNFIKISVSGVDDEAEILGHRKTYIGASAGRIITAMKKAKSINPVILIDEIDKMSKGVNGDPRSALLEVFDRETNKHFQDHYLDEEYDLSKVLFIATANYIEDIPLTLKDRLEIIELDSYTEYEKLQIAKNYLLPKIIKEHNLKEVYNFTDQFILDVIRKYTKESGIRELERVLSKIIRKIVFDNILDNSISSLKTTVEYLGKPKYKPKNKENLIGSVNALAYTYYGGDILPIEVAYFKGKGNLILTGSLGEVIKESAQIALSYIKQNYKLFNIDYKKLVESDIHINLPEGSIPKDGPSAGISLTTSIISAFTNLKIDTNIAMTGEITLRGNILAVGGLKEKIIGAYRNGINKIIIPSDNEDDLNEISDEIKDNIEFILVKDYKEVYNLLGGK